MISGLLFLALAFFAVAQAATVRNGGQSAADAAALAAARDDRDQFFDGFLDALGDKDSWQDWLDLVAPLTGDGCGAAGEYAGKNDSDVVACDAVTRERDPGYTVSIETRFTTGKTIIPGTDDKTATAEATAVVRPRCDFERGGGGDDGSEDGAGGDEAGGDDDGEDDGGGDKGSEPIEISCDGEDFELDPDDLDLDVEPSDLFTVVLVD
ncbi:hypothetical protein [Streptomyces sp. Z26]|uniref:hypothetical protein n=1 Tax=Streptomyces sp. Z26 TaxID=2500177 RepID=UPI000EF139B6|nr:hypothetical protein [Streptomyces sp. Z26]RLL68699.1 hypothetical protein D7M15_19745 [Streptomyces sp. Z26]